MLRNADVATVLEELAIAGGFKVYVVPEITDVPPVTLDFVDAELVTVLRFLATAANLSYRVLNDNTLLVSVVFVAPYSSTSPARISRCRSSFYLC